MITIRNMMEMNVYYDEKVNTYAFDGCVSLNAVTISDSSQLKSVNPYAFRDCCSLTSITIPRGATYIDGTAFSGCLLINAINVDDNNADYKTIDGNLYTKDGLTLVKYAIGKSQTSFNIPNGVTTISQYAFEGASMLKTIIMPDSLTKIEMYAFSECEALDYIAIPDSVKDIRYRAFNNCNSLTSVIIPDSVIYMGSCVFSGYNNALTICCEASSKPSGWEDDWNSTWYDDTNPVVWNYNSNDVADDGYIYTVVDGVRYQLKDGIATVVAQPVNTITANIQETITYEDVVYEVTSIVKHAFYYNKSLTSVIIPDSVTHIEKEAFYQNAALVVYCEASSMPDGWDEDWNYEAVVWDCNNNDVADDGYIYTTIDGLRYKLKDGVAIVMRQSNKIVAANIPESVIYKDNTYDVTTIDRYAFSGCYLLKSVVIPDSVVLIDYCAFYYCISLTDVGRIGGITHVGYRAFTGCNSLTSIIISENVSLSYWDEYNGAFYGCNSLIIYNESRGDVFEYWLVPNVYWYSESEPDDYMPDGNYWHYVDGVVTKW